MSLNLWICSHWYHHKRSFLAHNGQRQHGPYTSTWFLLSAWTSKIHMAAGMMDFSMACNCSTDHGYQLPSGYQQVLWSWIDSRSLLSMFHFLLLLKAIQNKNSKSALLFAGEMVQLLRVLAILSEHPSLVCSPQSSSSQPHATPVPRTVVTQQHLLASTHILKHIKNILVLYSFYSYLNLNCFSFHSFELRTTPCPQPNVSY